MKPARDKFSFDVEGAILFFGGFVTFQKQLLSNGMDAPTYNNFRGWRTRRTMSSDLIARMTRLARILDVPFDLHNYIIDPISMTSKLPPAAVQSEDDPDPEYDGNERLSPLVQAASELVSPEPVATPEAPPLGHTPPEPVTVKPVGARGMRRSRDV